MTLTGAGSKIRMLDAMVGNTPLLEVRLRYEGEERILYAKAEHLNMTGSIKDRMALHIIRTAYLSGDLAPGGRIIEVTSGNTGIAFSALGRALGHPVTIFMPDWMSAERINLMKALGAEIVLISKGEGGFIGSIEKAEQLAAEEQNAFLPSQFANESNCEAHYLTTGPEIWWQLGFRDLKPDAFIAGVGTGGTIMGVGQFLREQYPETKLYPLEPASSPTLSTGCKVGKHRIQGISDEFIPPILHLDELDDVVAVDDGDGILMAQKLGAQLGVAVGISSGANLIGALRVQNEIGADATVVTVFSDDNKKYLSTDLLKFEPVRDRYLSPRVDLISVRAFKRVCMTCCDPETCVELASMEEVKGPKLPHCARRE